MGIERRLSATMAASVPNPSRYLHDGAIRNAAVEFATATYLDVLGLRPSLGRWSIARGVAGLIGVGTGIGLFLSILAMLALRASSGSGDIGIGSISVYRPNIDPVALLAIAAVTAVVGVAAAFVPARRAVRMHPLVALRHD